MTFCLFIAAGILFRKLGTDEIHDLRGLFRKMPFTSAGFLVGAAAMVGIPPTCGFFSKWYLIQGGIAAGRYEYVAALIISSLINAVLFFRIIEIGYFPKSVDSQPAPDVDPEHGDQNHHHQEDDIAVDEATPSALITLYLAAAALIGIGLYAGDIANLIQSTLTPLLTR